MPEKIFCLFESFSEEVELDQKSRKKICFRPWGVVNEVRNSESNHGDGLIGVVYRTPLGTLRRVVLKKCEVDLIETDREHWSLMFELIMWNESAPGLEGPAEGTLVH